MILADFLKAAIPAPVTCLGVRLRPLSLGSLLLLYRFDNAYVNNRAPSLGDLLQGVIVCSLEFDEAQAALSDPDLSKDLKKWGDKLRGGIFSKRRKTFTARIQYASELFKEYISEGMKYPCTKAECGPTKDIGSPWMALTLTGLMAELGQDLDTAINQPLALSRWLVAANGERKGTLEVVERSELADLQKEADAIAREVFGEVKS